MRAFLLALQYGVNDSVELLLAPVYWVLAGFGRRLDSPASIARHQRLQWWSDDAACVAWLDALWLDVDRRADDAMGSTRG